MARRSRTLRGLLAAGSATTLLFAAACGSPNSDTSNSGSDADGDTVKVLAVLSLTGPRAALAPIYNDGTKTAVDLINKNGGLLGKQVELVIKDDQGDPTQAVNIVNSELSSGAKYAAVQFGTISSVAVPVAPILTKYKQFSVTGAASSNLDDPSAFPYMFMSSRSSEQQSAAVAQYAANQGVTKVAALYSDDESGQALAATMTAQAKAAGLDLTLASLPVDAVDATSQLEKLKAGSPDMLFLGGVGAYAPTILKSRAKLAWDVPTVGDPVFAVNDFSSLTPEQLQNVFLLVGKTQVAGTDVTTAPVFTSMTDALRAGVDGSYTLPADQYTLQTTPLLMAAAAIEKAGSFDADKIKAALEDGVTESDLWPLDVPIEYSSDTHFPSWELDNYEAVKVVPLEDGFYPASAVVSP